MPRGRTWKCCCPPSGWCGRCSTRRSPRRWPDFPRRSVTPSWRGACSASNCAKAHTRTDWSRRPLSAEQQEYALDDVRHLPPLRASLLETLRAQGPPRLARGGTRGARPTPTRCASSPRMRGERSRDCRRWMPAASGWRSRWPPGASAAPIERNRPRGWILDDAVLREIVLRLPRSPEALAALPEMQESVVRKCGEELLALVRDAGIADPPPPLPRRERPDPAQLGAREAARRHRGGSRAGELEISPEVLATRRELEKLARRQARRQPAARLARRRGRRRSCWRRFDFAARARRALARALRTRLRDRLARRLVRLLRGAFRRGFLRRLADRAAHGLRGLALPWRARGARLAGTRRCAARLPAPVSRRRRRRSGCRAAAA